MELPEALKEGQEILSSENPTIEDYDRLNELVDSFPESEEVKWFLDGFQAAAGSDVLKEIALRDEILPPDRTIAS